jgi:hypothetical protein
MTSRKRSSESHGLGEDAGSHSKKSKVSAGETTSKVDTNGDRYWEISRMRRVTVSSFRGKSMVNVREYYEKDGQELPGKKVSGLLFPFPHVLLILITTKLGLIIEIHSREYQCQ